MTVENAVQIPRREQFKAEEEEEEEEHVAAKKAAGFSDALLAPLPANPLRIFVRFQYYVIIKSNI